MSGEIADLRRELDEIDRELVRLFEKRMAVSRLVAAYKKKNKLPVLDAAREEQVISSRQQMLSDRKLEAPLRELWMEIMRLSRLEQESALDRGDAK